MLTAVAAVAALLGVACACGAAAQRPPVPPGTITHASQCPEPVETPGEGKKCFVNKDAWQLQCGKPGEPTLELPKNKPFAEVTSVTFGVERCNDPVDIRLEIAYKLRTDNFGSDVQRILQIAGAITSRFTAPQTYTKVLVRLAKRSVFTIYEYDVGEIPDPEKPWKKIELKFGVYMVLDNTTLTRNRFSSDIKMFACAPLDTCSPEVMIYHLSFGYGNDPQFRCCVHESAQCPDEVAFCAPTPAPTPPPTPRTPRPTPQPVAGPPTPPAPVFAPIAPLPPSEQGAGGIGTGNNGNGGNGDGGNGGASGQTGVYVGVGVGLFLLLCVIPIAIAIGLVLYRRRNAAAGGASDRRLRRGTSTRGGMRRTRRNTAARSRAGSRAVPMRSRTGSRAVRLAGKGGDDVAAAAAAGTADGTGATADAAAANAAWQQGYQQEQQHEQLAYPHDAMQQHAGYHTNGYHGSYYGADQQQQQQQQQQQNGRHQTFSYNTAQSQNFHGYGSYYGDQQQQQQQHMQHGRTEMQRRATTGAAGYHQPQAHWQAQQHSGWSQQQQQQWGTQHM